MDTIESILKKMEGYPSFEVVSTIELDGRCRVVGINRYPANKIMEITFHTIPIEEVGLPISNRSEVTDFTRIKLTYDEVGWLAPRLDGLRKAYGIESGYDILNKRHQKPQ